MFIHNNYWLKSHHLLSLLLCYFLVKMYQKCMFDDLIYQKFHFSVSFENLISQGTTSFLSSYNTQGGKTKQQQDGNDGVVSIFMSKVPHLGNTVDLASSSCSPTASSQMLWWRRVSVGTTASDNTLICSQSPISFPCDQTLAGSSLKPSRISRDLILTFLLPGAVQTVRLDGRVRCS